MRNTLIFIIIAIGLIFLSRYYRQEMIANKEKAELYRQNTDTLLAKIRKIYDEKILLEQQNKDLHEAAKKDQAYFDWHRDISQSNVIKQLRQNRVRLSGNSARTDNLY